MELNGKKSIDQKTVCVCIYSFHQIELRSGVRRGTREWKKKAQCIEYHIKMKKQMLNKFRKKIK